MAKNCPWLSVPAQLSMIDDDDDEPPIDLFLFYNIIILAGAGQKTN